ncbi:10_t:CDS:1, partial [Acaulospora colombiana]
HDPAFSRRGVHPNDPWLPGHGLRLEVGATPLPTAPHRHNSKRSHRDVEPAPSTRMPMSLQAILSPPGLPTTTITTSASYSSHGASTLSYPYHPHHHHQPQEPLSAAPFYASSTKVHQLPTPLPTPTSPPPNVLSGDAKLKISVQTRRDHQDQEQPFSSVATYIRTQHSARNGTHQSKSASTSSAAAISSSAATHLRKASHPTSPTTTSTVRKMTASGPFAAGQSARKAYFHTRTASGASAESSYGSGSGSGSVVSKHSLAAMLNPVSPAESASRRADYFSEQQQPPTSTPNDVACCGADGHTPNDDHPHSQGIVGCGCARP